MASTTYAAVHVGSNELCMKIYEMSRQNGIRQLTYVRHPLSLGAESYTEGVISYQTLSEICNTLNDFKRIMTEFHTDSWDVCATSAMREAKNVLIVTDQIKAFFCYTADPVKDKDSPVTAVECHIIPV